MERLESLNIADYKIYQDDEEYCFTSDAVLLSKFVKAKKGEVVADFCSGSGIVGINFFLLNDGVESVSLFELQKKLYDLSVKTINLNGFEKITAYNVPLQEIPNELNGKFSLILVNPPYLKVVDRDKQPSSTDICKAEYTVTLEEITAIAAKKLKFGGRLAMVHRADRLADVIYNYKLNKIEPKRLQFVNGRDKSDAYLILVEGVKGGRTGLKIERNIIN